MTNPAITVAQAIAAAMPAKPKCSILGGAARRAELLTYGAHYAAARAAWQYAAHITLNEAVDASGGKGLDADIEACQGFIDAEKLVENLQEMCGPGFCWGGSVVSV